MNIINNIKTTGQSDIIISYGINNYISKIFIENILNINEDQVKNNEEQEQEEENDRRIDEEDNNNEIYNKQKVKLLHFNSIIHNTEDYILKKFYECLFDRNKERRINFDNRQREIEDYYYQLSRYNKQKDAPFIIIVFENIEHLFLKKKQILIYTLLEIINNQYSSNILFVGLTMNFNLTDLMEKRVRSRFSQKTVFINLELPSSSLSKTNNGDYFKLLSDAVISFIESDLSVDLITTVELPNSESKDEKSKSKEKKSKKSKKSKSKKHNSKDKEIKKREKLKHSLIDLFNLYIHKNELFISLFQKYINLGLGIKEILNNYKYIVLLIFLEIKSYYKQISKSNIKNNEAMFAESKIMNKMIIEKVLSLHTEEQNQGAHYITLKSK